MRIIFLLFATTSSLWAQDIERILVPFVVPAPTPGAHGSQWVTELSILNDGDTGVLIEGYDPKCPWEPCFDFVTTQGRTFYPSVVPTLQGRFLVVRPAAAAVDVVVQLRARDLSRQMDDWGVQIPVVRESDAPQGDFDLLDIPTDARYRLMLRVYSFTEGGQARVRFYGVAGLTVPDDDDELLVEELITLTANWPGYAEIASILERYPVLAQFERLRIEVTALREDVRLWGFVTITNNETQHVTVISPQ